VLAAPLLASPPARIAALAIGLLLAFAVAATHRVPAGTGQLGFDVELSATSSGEIAVSPQGRVALASGLIPGGRSAAGSVVLLNQTSSRLELAPVADAPEGEADRSVWIALTRNDRTIVSAPLADMRKARGPVLALGPHERARLMLHAWRPKDAPAGWQGRVSQIQIGWRAWVDGKVRR
jgi:hypothetical protein